MVVAPFWVPADNLAVRGVAVTEDESAALNIQGLITPDKETATLIGVMHNLHCLVSLAVSVMQTDDLTFHAAGRPPDSISRILLSQQY